MVKMKILGITGSLRKNSSNTAILLAAQKLAIVGMEIEITDFIGRLPHFNPDLDNESVDPSVLEWRGKLSLADGFLISCPEYAHGVPGSFKNALDWVVSSGEFMNKPVLFLNASPIVKASLTETLTVMTANVLLDASIQIPFLRNKTDKEGNLVLEEEVIKQIQGCLEALRLHTNI
ncbi:MAG TPA: NADPH-dependent FMN reductase [Leptospiraceae bacterium]|nr:NADPH-dependent FMN reductase [Leptospiraceae bacterium]